MTAERPADQVVVVIGSGGMGIAAARRLGPGRRLVLADYSPVRLAGTAGRLADEGFAVETVAVNVADADAVRELAAKSGSYGDIAAVIHTAGVSPAQASSRDIFGIDLLGTAHVIDAFYPLAGPGTALVCISSMAGHKYRIAVDIERALATAPTAGLLAISGIDYDSPDTSRSYDIAKRGVQVRVAAASLPWGLRGARINSVSPGIIYTPMSREELDGAHGDFMRSLVRTLPIPRMGTPEDIAAAVGFLCSPAASFITGTDLLVDGGAVASLHWQANTS